MPETRRPDPGSCDGSVPSTGACDGSVFVLSRAFQGVGGVSEWAALNPQPLPPGDWVSSEIGFLTPITSLSAGDASFALSITENGAPPDLLARSRSPRPGR